MSVEIGTDIVSVPRIARLIAGRGDAFLHRCFTVDEITYCRAKAHPEQHFAARFAAKESVIKALRWSWDGPPPWRCAEVGHDDTGAPSISLTGTLLQKARSDRVGAIQVSLSHCADFATATVVAEREPAPRNDARSQDGCCGISGTSPASWGGRCR